MSRESHLQNAATIVDLGRAFDGFRRSNEGESRASLTASQTFEGFAAGLREREANEHARAVVERFLGRTVRSARWSGLTEITAEMYGEADQIVVNLVVAE
jgi:hypothetical protein